jgi:hypothetical protein
MGPAMPPDKTMKLATARRATGWKGDGKRFMGCFSRDPRGGRALWRRRGLVTSFEAEARIMALCYRRLQEKALGNADRFC